MRKNARISRATLAKSGPYQSIGKTGLRVTVSLPVIKG
jgi:hypothetical protein